MSIELQPTVCLDGTAVRRIREEKKLTQLYVAKVVGVTTDTVSRWENNRYPSIRRDNAQRLADALEVPLEDVLQKPAEADSPEPPQRRRLPLVSGAILLFLLLAGAGYLLLRGRDAPVVGVRAERILPSFAAPGSVLPVRVRIQVDEQTRGFILREHFPPGWKLIEANPPASSLDNEDGAARWILKPGESRQIISYLVRVASDAALGGAEAFRGEVIANPNGRNRPSPIDGAGGIRVAAFVWADQNGDGVVDDGEMLQASDTFDEMKGVHLDWKQLETIWDAGGYRWNAAEQRFIPVRSGLP